MENPWKIHGYSKGCPWSIRSGRGPEKLTANRITAPQKSINLAIHVISSSIYIYLDLYMSYIILAYPVLQGGPATGTAADAETCNAVLGHFWDTFLRLILRLIFDCILRPHFS